MVTIRKDLARYEYGELQQCYINDDRVELVGRTAIIDGLEGDPADENVEISIDIDENNYWPKKAFEEYVQRKKK